MLVPLLLSRLELVTQLDQTLQRVARAHLSAEEDSTIYLILTVAVAVDMAVAVVVAVALILTLILNQSLTLTLSMILTLAPMCCIAPADVLHIAATYFGYSSVASEAPPCRTGRRVGALLRGASSSHTRAPSLRAESARCRLRADGRSRSTIR